MPFTAHFKAVVTIGMDTALPKDVAVNTWHCDALTPDGPEDFVDALEVFYQAIDSVIWSAAIDPSNVRCDVYRMADPEPRVPVLTTMFTGLTATASARPPELAVCLSFQGDLVSGEPQRRRRGRVYLGPVGNIEASSTSPLVATSTVNAVAAAGNVLAATSTLSSTFTWCVFSEIDADLIPVTNGWVDNDFDIQRRRGLLPTVRTTFDDA